MKKAFAITFQWIFAIIAGAIIFSFLIKFGYDQIALSNKQTSLELINDLELELSIIEDLDKEINLKGNFEFTCDNIILNDYKQQTEKIISSPYKNKALNIWVRAWYYPFKITNFYYISDAKFYLFDSLEIPLRFNVIKNPSSFAKDSVFILSSQQQLENALKYSKNIKIINKDSKTITFYPDITVSYIDDAFLYLAIFSPDYTTFTCLQNKALEKFKLIIDLYKEKALFLQKSFPNCPYYLIIPTLEQFKTNLALKDTIITQNNLLKQNDCPELF